jgi:hypothetical protein
MENAISSARFARLEPDLAERPTRIDPQVRVICLARLSPRLGEAAAASNARGCGRRTITRRKNDTGALKWPRREPQVPHPPRTFLVASAKASLGFANGTPFRTCATRSVISLGSSADRVVGPYDFVTVGPLLGRTGGDRDAVRVVSAVQPFQWCRELVGDRPMLRYGA